MTLENIEVATIIDIRIGIKSIRKANEKFIGLISANRKFCSLSWGWYCPKITWSVIVFSPQFSAFHSEANRIVFTEFSVPICRNVTTDVVGLRSIKDFFF